jgi:hypothetical protein
MFSSIFLGLIETREPTEWLFAGKKMRQKPEKKLDFCYFFKKLPICRIFLQIQIQHIKVSRQTYFHSIREKKLGKKSKNIDFCCFVCC